MSSKTREKLIEVAQQLFAIKGVAHTTMKDIATASAKGRRTIYTYFKNKKDIYNAVLEGESDRLVEALHRVMELPVPIENRLAEFLRVRLERYLAPSNMPSMRAWLKFDVRRFEKVQSMAKEKENALLADLLDEGIREGVFSPVRCSLLRGFMNLALRFEDSQLPAEEDLEERRRSISTFITFIVSDLTGKTPFELNLFSSNINEYNR